MDWTQIITIYKGPLHIINNYNSTCVSNSKIQIYNIIINSLKNEKKVRKYKDINDYESLSNITLRNKLKVREQRFYCCSTFHSFSNIFNKVHTSYVEMSVKWTTSLQLSVAIIYIPISATSEHFY